MSVIISPSNIFDAEFEVLSIFETTTPSSTASKSSGRSSTLIPRGYSFSVEEAGTKVLSELYNLPRTKSSLIVLPFLTTFAVDLVPGNFLPTM